MEAAPLALTVVSPRGRRDVVVTPRARVGQLCDALDLDAQLLTVDGAGLAREALLGDVLRSGDAVVVETAGGPALAGGLAAGPGAVGAGAWEAARPALGPLPVALLGWCAVALAALALVPRLLDLSAGAAARPGLAAVAGVVALALALLPPLTSRLPEPRAAARSTVAATDAVTAAAWVVAAAAGLDAVAAHPAAGLALPVTIALLAATLTTAIRTVRLSWLPSATPGGAAQVVAMGVLPRAALLVGGVAALVGVLAITAERAYPVAVLLGLTPMALRLVPAGSVAVPESVLLDPGPSQRTATKVRERYEEAPANVRWGTISVVVALGRRRRRVAASLLAITTALLALALTLALPAGRLELAATVALSLLVAGCFVLVARRDREPVSAWVTRAASGAVLLPGCAALARLGVPALALTIAVVVLAGLAVALAPALAREWRSLWWSRLGDGVESLAVALSPGLGLVSAGAVGAMMLAAAG